MNNITVEVSINIESLIKRLTIRDKIELAKKLERETRSQRWNSLITVVETRFAKKPISEKEIKQVCKEVRQQRYEKNTKSCP